MDYKKNLNIEKFELINFLNITDIEQELIRNWRNDKNIRKWMYSDHIITKEEHINFLEKIKNDNKNLYWILKEQDKYLGVICINKIDFNNKNAYFGLYSNPDAVYLGLGRVMDKISIDLAFKILNLNTLKLEVIESNKQVINLHKKMGFLEEGRLKEFVYRDDKWQDVVIMGMTKEYYENQK